MEVHALSLPGEQGMHAVMRAQWNRMQKYAVARI